MFRIWILGKKVFWTFPGWSRLRCPRIRSLPNSLMIDFIQEEWPMTIFVSLKISLSYSCFSSIYVYKLEFQMCIFDPGWSIRRSAQAERGHLGPSNSWGRLKELRASDLWRLKKLCELWTCTSNSRGLKILREINVLYTCSK